MSYVNSRRAQYECIKAWNEILKSVNSSGLAYGPHKCQRLTLDESKKRGRGNDMDDRSCSIPHLICRISLMVWHCRRKIVA